MLAPNAASFDVIDAGTAEPFSLPITAVRHLREFSAQAAFGRLVHVRASVILQRAGTSLFVRDATGTLFCETRATTPVAIGDIVDVVGFLGIEDNAPKLVRATYERRSAGPPPIAHATTVAEIFEGKFVDELLRVRGYLTAVAPESLTVQSGPHTFVASLDNGRLDTLSLVSGSEVELTGVGIVSFRGGKVQSFKMRLRSTGDVQVLRTPVGLVVRAADGGPSRWSRHSGCCWPPGTCRCAVRSEGRRRRFGPRWKPPKRAPAPRANSWRT